MKLNKKISMLLFLTSALFFVTQNQALLSAPKLEGSQGIPCQWTKKETKKTSEFTQINRSNIPADGLNPYRRRDMRKANQQKQASTAPSLTPEDTSTSQSNVTFAMP